MSDWFGLGFQILMIYSNSFSILHIMHNIREETWVNSFNTTVETIFAVLLEILGII